MCGKGWCASLSWIEDVIDCFRLLCGYKRNGNCFDMVRYFIAPVKETIPPPCSFFSPKFYSFLITTPPSATTISVRTTELTLFPNLAPWSISNLFFFLILFIFFKCILFPKIILPNQGTQKGTFLLIVSLSRMGPDSRCWLAPAPSHCRVKELGSTFLRLLP